MPRRLPGRCGRNGGRRQPPKSRSQDPITTHFDLILHFFVRIHSGQLVFVTSFYLQPFPRYGGSGNSKSMSRDPITTPFDLILHFFSLGAPVANLCAKFEVSSFIPLFRTASLHVKFEVSSFNHSRDNGGVPKF